jgi:hypothetical protein
MGYYGVQNVREVSIRWFADAGLWHNDIRTRGESYDYMGNAGTHLDV